jgi:hypothetical protein
MKKLLCYGAALAVAFAAACGPEDRTAREELAVAADEDRGFRTDEPAAVVPVPDTLGTGLTMTGNLMEMGGSGASGVVTITPEDGATLVRLSLTGVQPNTQAIPTIHRGACAEPGQLVEQLQPVPIEGTGLGTANLVVDLPTQTIADGLHSIRVYPEAGLDVAPLACADLPEAAEPGRY